MTLNSRGQEFDVFKLVIAAIVAVAILGVLLSIMGGLVLPGSEPGPEITRVVKSLINAPGQPGKTNPVTFKQGTALTAAAIAVGTGSLGEDQICFSTGDFGEDQFEVSSDGRVLSYKRTTDFTARAQVICAAGDSLEEWVTTTYTLDWDLGSCTDRCMNSDVKDTCCIVAAVRQ